MVLVQKEIKAVYTRKTEGGILTEHQIRPEIPPYLCFTANTANSTVALTKVGSPTAVSLEMSTDGENWSTYTTGATITLSNVGDKVYLRNTSTTTVSFATSYSAYHRFSMSGSISVSGDIYYLLNKNSTDTLTARCFFKLFENCSSLTTAPSLPAMTLSDDCYRGMFMNSGITTIPALPATFMPRACYAAMFYGCYGIKISSSKTGDYVNDYRMPMEGTGTEQGSTFTQMFYNTGGTYKYNPSINTTYYTSNTVV